MSGSRENLIFVRSRKWPEESLKPWKKFQLWCPSLEETWRDDPLDGHIAYRASLHRCSILGVLVTRAREFSRRENENAHERVSWPRKIRCLEISTERKSQRYREVKFIFHVNWWRTEIAEREFFYSVLPLFLVETRRKRHWRTYKL